MYIQYNDYGVAKRRDAEKPLVEEMRTTRSFASLEVLPFTSFDSNIIDVSLVPVVCEGLPFKIKSRYENNQATDFVPNNIIPVRHTT